MTPSLTVTVRHIPPAELTSLVPGLARLLSDAVNGGASLGFLAPLTADVSRDYWRSLRTELDSGSRLLIGVFHDDRLVGSGQLVLPGLPNARHRAEIQKVFVEGALRGQGVGQALMAALHETAGACGRTLVLLNARHGGPAERFYRWLGYREVGVVPGYTIGPGRERIDSLSMYRELDL